MWTLTLKLELGMASERSFLGSKVRVFCLWKERKEERVLRAV